MSKFDGGCLCGAIRYTCAAEPVATVICNCTHCQKQSGSTFSVIVGIPKGSLQLSGDVPARFADKGDSGLAVSRRFCAKCGSPILSEVAATPDLDWLKAGTLDDPSWLKPEAVFWCDSAQPWMQFPDALPKFPKGPPEA